MLTNDIKQIILLNPVRINYDLKKWNPDDKKDLSWSSGAIDAIGSTGGNNFFNNDTNNVWDGVPFSIRRQYTSPFWRSVVNAYIKFRLVFTKPKKDPVKFFMELKDNFQELEKTDIPDAKISTMLNNLEKSRQKFAVASLVSEKNLTKIENKLFAADFKQYQTEESLISFIKKCEKGLCLTEIEYFDRVIPEDVMAKFEKAEELGVFDNYYILYHDPKKAKNKYYTQDKPKDPIMFGVISGSTKLYFVADWIDEFCNLTYKDILTKNVDYKLTLKKEPT